MDRDGHDTPAHRVRDDKILQRLAAEGEFGTAFRDAVIEAEEARDPPAERFERELVELRDEEKAPFKVRVIDLHDGTMQIEALAEVRVAVRQHTDGVHQRMDRRYLPRRVLLELWHRIAKAVIRPVEPLATVTPTCPCCGYASEHSWEFHTGPVGRKSEQPS